MKITDIIKEHSTKLILSAIFGVLGILIGSLYSQVIPILLPIIIQELPKPVLLKMLTAAILLFLLSTLAALFIYSHYRPKLVPKFGLLWDKNKEPYCPACRNPLSQYLKCQFSDEGTSEKVFWCVKCDKYIYLTYNGDVIELDEAKKML